MNIDYRAAYDLIVALQEELAAQHHDAEIGCLDYKVVKALGATYELQDYLANRIAQTVATGELGPEPEGETYGLLDLIEQLPEIGKLTSQHRKYIETWDQMNISHSLFRAAYEITVLNTGAFSWPYAHKLLQNYSKQGLLNAEDVRVAWKKAHQHK